MNTASCDDHVFINMVASIVDHEIDLDFVILMCFEEFGFLGVFHLFAGETIRPLVIGKFKKSRCFNNVVINSLPVLYRANKKAWMTSALYEEWLKWFDR